MSTTLRAFALILATSLAGPVLAQDETPPAADESTLSMGEEATPQLGDTYTQEKFGDWAINCVKTDQETDPCQMYYLIADGQGNPVAEMTIFDVPNGQTAAAGAVVITPLGTLLTTQVTLKIDDNDGKRYPFSWCDQSGCNARLGLTGQELLWLQKGSKLVVTIRAVRAPDQKIDLTVSLAGFSDAFKAIQVPNN